MKRFILLLFIFILFYSFSFSEFVKTVYVAELLTDSVVPSVTSNNGNGIAVCIYDRNDFPKSLDCEIQFYIDSSHGPFYAGIYRGSPFENGELLYEFQGQIQSNFRQIFSLEDIIFDQYDYYSSNDILYSINEQEYDFLNGNWYIVITSNDYEFGAIRGSLLQEHFMYAKMDNNQVVPVISENNIPNTHGITIGTYSYFNPFKIANYYIVHDVDIASNIEIRQAKEGEIGGGNYIFSSTISPIEESVSYTSTTEFYLLDDEQYIQIISPQYPNGEIRGQLHAINQFPTASFTARLDGLSVLPSSVSTIARGCGLFSLDCNNFLLEYIVYHTVTQPTGAWMNLGDRYTDGIKLWPLSRNEGPIYGSRILEPDEILAFYQNRLYITIESIVYPEGEIRGQISDTYNLYAYLSGNQLNPPLTTSGVGCGTFRLDEVTNKGRKFNYDIYFELPDTDYGTVELIHGDRGIDGENIATLGDSFTSVSGSNIFLSNNEVNFVGTEKTYIQIGDSTIAGGKGKLRGQIYHITNPCPFITSLPQESISDSPTSFWRYYQLPTYIEWNGN